MDSRLHQTLVPALEQAVAAIVLIDEANRVRFFNAAAERLWGYDRQEVLGRSVTILVPRAIQPHHDGYIDANRKGQANTIVGSRREVRLERKDGSETWAIFSLSKVAVGGNIRYLAFAHDISAEVAQREENRLLSLAVDATDRPMLILDEDRRIVQLNPAFTALFGFPSEEAIGQRPTDFLAGPATGNKALERLRQQAWATDSFQAEILATRKDGRDIWVRINVDPILEDGRLRNLVVVISDVTEERQIQDLEHDILNALTSTRSFSEIGNLLCRRIEEMAPETRVSVCGVADRRLRPWAAPSFHASYGPDWEGVEIGEGVAGCGTAAHRGEPVMVHDIDTDPLWAPYKHQMLPHGYKACWTYPVKRRDGLVVGTFAFYFQRDAEPNAFLQRVAEASIHLCALAIEREENSRKIAHLSHFDGLTGLPNRNRLHDYVDATLSDAGDRDVAFLVIDLDLFKDVNNTLGRQAGDMVLIEIANRLSALTPANGLVSRYGDDTFTIVLPGFNARQASAMADRVLQALCAPFDISGFQLRVSATIGISLYADNGRDRETLLNRADTAMHQAKSAGRGGYLFFSPEMNKAAQERMVLGAALRKALSSSEMTFHYQPQIDLSSGRLHGVEALARWSDPVLGEIAPGRFVPLAEELGLAKALGQWSLRKACRQMAEWRDRGVLVPVVSVNLSTPHFADCSLPAYVAGLLEEFDLPPSCLTIEITESIMMDPGPETPKTLAALRALGVGLSMDDFGTGFSSLGSLTQLPITELKLDQSFMREFATDPNTQAVATAVVRIGQSLDMIVVSEGVETEDQARLLRLLGCSVAQGYHFAKPMAPGDLEQWLGASLFSDEANAA